MTNNSNPHNFTSFAGLRNRSVVVPPREQQLRDIAISGNEDAAECASSDAFKEFPGKEGC